MRLFSIDRTGSTCIKLLGKTFITFFDNILMTLSSEEFKCDCDIEDLIARDFTDEVLSDIKDSEFGSEYIRFLQKSIRTSLRALYIIVRMVNLADIFVV